MSNLFVTLIDCSLLAIYYLILACFLLLFISHTICCIEQSKAVCKQQKLNMQIEFLMSGNYYKLLKFARLKGLVTKPIKKYQLCQIIAAYQLST